jgi:hypothetical protein
VLTHGVGPIAVAVRSARSTFEGASRALVTMRVVRERDRLSWAEREVISSSRRATAALNMDFAALPVVVLCCHRQRARSAILSALNAMALGYLRDDRRYRGERSASTASTTTWFER